MTEKPMYLCIYSISTKFLKNVSCHEKKAKNQIGVWLE